MSDVNRISPAPPIAQVLPVRAPRKSNRDSKRPKPDGRSREERGSTSEEDDSDRSPSASENAPEVSHPNSEDGAQDDFPREGGVNLRV